MKINFTKMHGAGNDYIFIDCFGGIPFDPCALAKKMSRRRFSVGSDGVILICPSICADAKMRIFNLDGSEGKMCGNGARCVGKYLFESGISKKRKMSIETLAGVRRLSLDVVNDNVESVTVDMGRASLFAKDIPVIFKKERVVGEEIDVCGEKIKITCVSVGNPHAVSFLRSVRGQNVPLIGKKIGECGIFPDGVNAEFAEVVGKNALFVRVFERGSGETLSCGTGACASAVAAAVEGLCEYGAPISVTLPGGELKVSVSKSLDVMLTGGAETVYSGVYEYESEAE